MMTPEEHSNAIETQWREDEKRLRIIDVADVLAEDDPANEKPRLGCCTRPGCGLPLSQHTYGVFCP